MTRRQDLNTFLSVLFRAVQEYGPPEAFVTDSGSIFLANRAQAIYRAHGIRKVEIEKGRPWQSYLETAWNVQRRIADHYFAGAEDWSGLLQEHDRWLHDYNVQEHYAHRHRKLGRRSPSAVLMNPAEQARRLATLNDRRSSVLAKGQRQPANLRSGFLECWSWPSQGAEAASASFMVPARWCDRTYVCRNAHQVIRPKLESAGPADSGAANLGIADSKRDK